MRLKTCGDTKSLCGWIIWILMNPASIPPNPEEDDWK
jgi:hypothetical protein